MRRCLIACEVSGFFEAGRALDARFARRERHARRYSVTGTGVARVIVVASAFDANFNVASP
jgi:hypothetical protein